MEYRDSLKAFLTSKVSDPADVDDLLQELLLKTHKNIHTIKSNDSVKPWLFQVANRTIIDFYRKKAKSRDLEPGDLWYEEENGDEAQQELSRCIEPFIKSLPTGMAELLTAIELQGQSQKDYAKAAGISYSTLKSRVQKARRELRETFEQCCHFDLDTHGNIIDYEVKSADCKSC